MAFGIAASTAAGLRQNFGTMTKPLHPGQAAMNGVTAAQLAHLGWTADANILEAPTASANYIQAQISITSMTSSSAWAIPMNCWRLGWRSSNIHAVHSPTVRSMAS